MTETLLLIRHCRAAGQEADAPLTAEGRLEADALAVRLADAGIGRIVSSPFARAVQSVEPLALRLGVTVETDSRLVERVLSTQPRPDGRERLRESFLDLDLCFDGGESSREAIERGVAALDQASHGGAAMTAVVTHGNLLALLLHHLDGRPGFETWQRLTNPDVYRVDGRAEARTITRCWDRE